MEKKLDELLRHGLTPTEAPASRLNQKIIEACEDRLAGEETTIMKIEKKKTRRLPATAFAVVLAAGIGSLSAFAAWKYLLPEKVSEETGDVKLEEVLIAEPDMSPEKIKVLPADDFTVASEEGNEKGAEAVEYALQFVGTPYEWGEESLTEGCDSSGFTRGVFAHFGISLPHSASLQKNCGEEISGLENALPGDLLFYESSSHVGIYIGDGNVVHSYPKYGICISEADFDEIKMIRRIF